ncbi:glycoside hydrolase family 3 N-terminal domain-containing protein [Chelatococcus reniformis]|uniref:Beta-D-glucoside glucohydrolase n=1 Tax=Chelatococcus reniformis TaxID=1494448 RepID=A0A916TZQ1_9HYPH|nr:glycoside hydrolase family 3 N-terminal domain-containing protein [Chelatococcus reniformis]GGC54592.1 beta-glucosidase [Chelatococcus reniformis]
MRGQTAGAVALLALGLGPPSAAAVELGPRARALFERMTVAEKVGQLTLVSAGPGYDAAMLPAGRVGAVINFDGADAIAAVQRAARRARLAVPVLAGLDILHGFRTMFPVPLGEAAAFDPDLAERVSAFAGAEARAVGIRWTFAPMADLARDARWGRAVEGFGEDPLLGAALTAARVRGLRAAGIATSVKHFAGYGAPVGGRDYDNAEIPTALLWDVYLPPFAAAVAAGSETVMASLNALNGVPATANPLLLDTILRRRWGFDGFVVSDWNSIGELIAHGVAVDGAEAARKAILAGVDMDLASGLYDRHLADEVAAGRVPQAALDESVRRVLRVKERLGLLDEHPVAAQNPPGQPAQLTAAGRALAREAARDAIVLLANRGATLPLGGDGGLAGRRIALIGGLAASAVDQIGPHGADGRAEDVVTPLAGLRRRAETAGAALAYAPGCDPQCGSTDGFDAAVAAAAAADVVVAMLGEPQEMTGEAASRTTLALPGRQAELLDRLIATGRPVVLLLAGGRPLELGRAADRIQALLMTWFLGSEAGNAIADILFGDVAPSAKLPLTWPRHVGQSPIYYNALPSGRPYQPGNRFTMQYLDGEHTPLFPFGWGLSYGAVRYGELHLDQSELSGADTLRATVTVTNTGRRTIREVVQLYVHDAVASRSRPVRELKAFAKVALAPGESRDVVLSVPVVALGFHDDAGIYRVEPGAFDAFVGGSSLAELTARFSVTSMP